MTSERSPTSTLRPGLIALLAPLTVLLTGCSDQNLLEIFSGNWGLWGTVIIVLDLVALVDLLGDGTKSTTGRIVWTLLIIFFPIGGVILYFIFGRE